MTRHHFSFAVFFIAALTTAGAIAGPPPMWDNLVRTNSKTFDSVYILPGADFRGYTSVILEPTEVAFKKEWQRDYNNTTRSLSRRITDKEMQEMIELARTKFAEVFAKAYTDAGYQVVTAPGPDTLRIHTAVINMDVNAPDRPMAGRTMSFAEEAGEATIVIEARDSQTGEILGRAADRRTAGESTALLRNAMVNRRDFKKLFEKWATASARGLTTLKSMSPFNGAPVR